LIVVAFATVAPRMGEPTGMSAIAAKLQCTTAYCLPSKWTPHNPPFVKGRSPAQLKRALPARYLRYTIALTVLAQFVGLSV
jgi:hypothetical protein